MRQVDIENNFIKERSDLSTRATNILKALKIFEFNEFMDFMNRSQGGFNFKKVKNCGKHTVQEIEGLIREVLIKPQIKGGYSIATESSNVEVIEQNPLPNITLLYQASLKGFTWEGLEPLKQIHYIDEFNNLFSNLSARARNIFRALEIDNLRNILWFLQTAEIGFRFKKIQNCGTKAEKECDQFVMNVIEMIVSGDEKIKNNINHLQNCLFQILNSYVLFSNKFSKREIEIFKVRFCINDKTKKETLQNIADKFKLTRERIRQIEVKLQRRITPLVNKLIVEFKIDLTKYTSPKFFFIDEKFAKNINEIEETNFSLSFIIIVLSSIFKFEFAVHKIKTENKFFALAVEEKIDFDFKHCFDFLLQILNNPVRRKETSISFNDLQNKFSKKGLTEGPVSEMSSEIICAFLLRWDNVEIDGDNILISRNTELRIYERIESMLRQHQKPLHFTKIYHLLCEQGIRITNQLNVHSTLQRFPNIFGLKGQGIYGLREWGGCFGSIGDVAEEYLKKVKEPVSMKELEEFICRELIVSQESIREVLFHYAAENRFMKHRNGKVGLKRWEHVQLKIFR